MLDASNNPREGDHQMHTTLPGKRSHTPTSEEAHKQEPFTRVTPMLKTALLMGAGGGFVLATVLTAGARFLRAAWCVVGSDSAGARTSPTLWVGRSLCTGGRFALSPTTTRNAINGRTLHPLAAWRSKCEPDLAGRQSAIAFDEPG